MRSLVFAAIATAVLALTFAIAVPLFDVSGTPDVPEAEQPQDGSAPSPLPGKDSEITVTALIKGEARELTMHDYLVGVLSAEMPASFETEALRAQAVAARTYTLYKMLIDPETNHPEADVCDDINCCKAFADESDMLNKWGESTDTYRAKMETAVSSTDGLCIAYGGEPALAVFHSSSSGMTESSENVWGGTIPYLRAVDSPETESEVPNFISSVSVSPEDFKETVASVFPDAVYSDDSPPLENDAVYNESGRLVSITSGGVSLSGTQLRSLFELRSAAITIEVTDKAVILTTAGYGHGVGLSQYGANALAADGWDFSEILTHYYEGVELVSSDEFSAK